MKVRSSIKKIDPDDQIVKRRGRLYVINKKKPRNKQRQGWVSFNLSNHLLEENLYVIFWMVLVFINCMWSSFFDIIRIFLLGIFIVNSYLLAFEYLMKDIIVEIISIEY